jgi:hypothetical protein
VATDRQTPFLSPSLPSILFGGFARAPSFPCHTTIHLLSSFFTPYVPYSASSSLFDTWPIRRRGTAAHYRTLEIRLANRNTSSTIEKNTSQIQSMVICMGAQSVWQAVSMNRPVCSHLNARRKPLLSRSQSRFCLIFTTNANFLVASFRRPRSSIHTIHVLSDKSPLHFPVFGPGRRFYGTVSRLVCRTPDSNVDGGNRRHLSRPHAKIWVSERFYAKYGGSPWCTPSPSLNNSVSSIS